MLHLIIGGSASGKSFIGEKYAARAGAEHLYYLATMHPRGEEGKERVRRHRKQREGKGFLTIEAWHHLENVCPKSGMRKNTAILLECMSNLVANEQFEAGGTDEEILDRIVRGIQNLQARAENVIVITNDIFSDGEAYEAETMRYLDLLGRVNQMLAVRADRVTEVVYGIEIPVKTGNEDKK